MNVRTVIPARYDERLYKRSRWLDTQRRHLTDSPSPARFASLLKSVDQGDVAALWELQEEMECKDADLMGICETRRSALTALDWSIVPDPNAEDESASQEAADYVSERLTKIKAWPLALEFLSLALGPNVAIVELLWDRAELVDVVPVPGHRYTLHYWRGQDISIETEADLLGVAATLPGKFIVYHPNANGGFPFRKTLTHATVWPYLQKWFGRADWMSFSELYGLPWRVATVQNANPDDDRTDAQRMLEDMASDHAVTLPEGIEVEVIQATGKGEVFEAIIERAQKSLAILWLGQTLTSDIGDAGSRAAAQVHDNVRLVLLAGDAKKEARVLREQLFSPMVRLRFPGDQMPVPVFRRAIPEVQNVEAQRLRMDQLRFLTERNLVIDDDVLYETLDVPKPTQEPKGASDKESAATINELTLGIERAARVGDIGLANLLRKRIAGLLGETLPDLVELPSMEPSNAVT